jgi:hypothetical protein
MPLIFLMIFFAALHGENSFITQEEYSTQLYFSPRGIGCNHCHGDHGEGREVAQYKDKKELKTFSGPPINRLSYDEFYDAMNERKRGMPRYFLIASEIKALYFYLHKGEKRDSQ